MTLGVRVSTWLGFDPALLLQMKPRHRHAVTGFSMLCALPCALIGASGGYALWLIEGSFALAAICGAAFSALTLNLLRVSIAGGGMTVREPFEQAIKWKPMWTPVVLFGFLGVIFAQPAQLPLYAARLDPQIADYRNELIAAHDEAVVASAPASRQRIVAAYARRVNDSAFAMRRIQLIWQSPVPPAIFTAVFCLLVLFPLLLVRGTRLASVRAYEARRYDDTRTTVQAAYTRTQDRVERLLQRHRGYVGPAPERFVDPPFNTLAVESVAIENDVQARDLIASLPPEDVP